jgi:prepilin-type N-terminal cleavage/methylation domain-containing protein
VHQPDCERGFTIIELMIVVAIIAVLAIVVIPTFMKESRRASYKSEVHPMFAELGSRQDAIKVEDNEYKPAAACPPTANEQGTDITTAACATTGDWVELRVQAPQSKLKCSYTVAAGAATDSPTAATGVVFPTWITDAPASLATGWYWIKAECPTNEYFTASWDSKIRSQDGK